MPAHSPIPPGSTLGVLGSGQLGRMFAIAARQMGYRVHTFSPDTDTPTGQVADKEVTAAYDDLDAVRAFAREVAVVTFEFENVPAPTADAAAALVPVRPAGHVLHTTQNRLREKTFLAQNGFPVTPFAPVKSPAELRAALAKLGHPAVLKTAGWGYDGKGQIRIATPDQSDSAWTALFPHSAPSTQHSAHPPEAVLESWVAFEKEVSVVAARSASGEFTHWGVIENDHRHHILDLSTSPARIPPKVYDQATSIARSILESLDVIGVLTVEFFLTTDGKLLVNELAPRPHNSGHLTIDACHTSQFAQQVRAICNLPLGDTTQHTPAAAMANLLGGLWADGDPLWHAALEVPGTHLHLYGKHEPRPGRKMGHITALASTIDEARARALESRRRLTLRAQ